MIVVKEDRCDFCGTCVAVCPHDAINLYETRLEIDYDKCTLCMNCVYICPMESLEEKDGRPL